MSKLKARQIIPGWPRGRSSLPEIPTMHFVIYASRVSPKPGDIFEERLAKFLAEARENRAYHQAQSEMLDTWRRMQSDGSVVAVRGGFAPSYYVEMQRHEQGMMEYYQRMLTPTFIYDRNRLKRRVTPLGSSPGR